MTTVLTARRTRAFVMRPLVTGEQPRAIARPNVWTLNVKEERVVPIPKGGELGLNFVLWADAQAALRSGASFVRYIGPKVGDITAGTYDLHVEDGEEVFNKVST
jgi:hypothetical protein